MLLLLLLLAGPVLSASIVMAQQTSSLAQTLSQTPSQTPSQTEPPSPPPSTAQPPTSQPLLGPDGKPFVPPRPPAPSQSRIPGAFESSLIPAGAPRFTFTPTLTLSEQWTDNFFLTETQRTDNFRTTAGVGLDLLMNLPNTHGSLSTNLAFSYDSASDDEQTNFFPSFTGTVQQTFSPRLSLTLSDTFRRDDDPFYGDPNGVRRQRDTFVSNTFSASVNWLIDIFQTQYYYRNNLFLSDEGDSISHILGGNVSVPVGALNTLTGGYEFTYRDSSEDSDQIGNRFYGSLSRQIGTFTSVGVSSSFTWLTANTDSQIFNVSLFAAHGLPGGFSVSGSVGYSLFDSETSDPSNLASFSLNASYRFARGSVSVGVFQDVRQTADEGQDFGIVATRSANASFNYSFTAFITGSVYVTYSRNEPLEGGGSNFQSSTYLTAGANLSWQIANWLSLTLAYVYIDRDSDRSTNIGSNDFTSNQTLQNSTENRATATLHARF